MRFTVTLSEFMFEFSYPLLLLKKGLCVKGAICRAMCKKNFLYQFSSKIHKFTSVACRYKWGDNTTYSTK